MPIYEYEHIESESFCSEGKIFDIVQSINDDQLRLCPICNKPVRKLISRSSISFPKTNTELRDLGFTKLVKRDDGVYENVTRRDGDSLAMIRGKPETIPDLSKTISD